MKGIELKIQIQIRGRGKEEEQFESAERQNARRWRIDKSSASNCACPPVLPALYNFALKYFVLVVKYRSRCSWVYILLAVKRLAMNWAKQE